MGKNHLYNVPLETVNKALDETDGISDIGLACILRFIGREAAGRTLSLEDIEAVLDALLVEMDRLQLPPITGVELFLAEGCNLNCDYCFEGQKAKWLMSEETARKAVDFLLDSCGDAEKVRILFFGGEPLLNFEVLRVLVDYAQTRAQQRGKRVKFSMTTNGTLLTEPVVEFLHAARVGLMLSIDGTPAVHDRHRCTYDGRGSFEDVLRGLRCVQKYYSHFDVRVTVIPDTVEHLLDSVRYLHSLGIPRLVIGPAEGIEWSKSAWKNCCEQAGKVADFLRQAYPDEAKALSGFLFAPNNEIPNWGCYAGVGSVTVDARGNILPCSKFIGCPPLQQAYTLGNVYEGITRPGRRKEFLLINRQRGARCTKCPFSSRCGGGCLVTNYQMTGILVDPDPLTCRRMVLSRRLYGAPRKLPVVAGALLETDSSSIVAQECTAEGTLSLGQGVANT